MMSKPNNIIAELINSLCCLPGVGSRSAQRMAYHLLCKQRSAANNLAQVLHEACATIGMCNICRDLTADQTCARCHTTPEVKQSICIVEQSYDIMALENTNCYHGSYFVLHGHLSPIDGIGPSEIGIPLLIKRFQNEKPPEIILATNPNVEGETTAHFIADIAKKYQITCSRLANGVPFGSELGYQNINTLALAFSSRGPVENSSIVTQKEE
jgi:recombination protein RecR